MNQSCQPLPTMERNLAAPFNKNSVLSTIRLRHDISAFPGYGISLRRSTSCSCFFLARHSWRPCSGPPLYDCTHSTVLDTNSNVRLPPRPLGSQHPGDVKCGPLAYCDTTIIRLRYPARYPSDHPIAYCDKEPLILAPIWNALPTTTSLSATLSHYDTPSCDQPTAMTCHDDLYRYLDPYQDPVPHNNDIYRDAHSDNPSDLNTPCDNTLPSNN